MSCFRGWGFQAKVQRHGSGIMVSFRAVRQKCSARPFLPLPPHPSLARCSNHDGALFELHPCRSLTRKMAPIVFLAKANVRCVGMIHTDLWKDPEVLDNFLLALPASYHQYGAIVLKRSPNEFDSHGTRPCFFQKTDSGRVFADARLSAPLTSRCGIRPCVRFR